MYCNELHAIFDLNNCKSQDTYDLLLKYLKKHDKQEYKKYLEIYINYLISFATSYETNNIDSIWQSINKLEKAYDLSSADDKKKAILLQIQKLQQMSNNYLGKTNIDISKEVNEFSNCFNNLIKDKDFQSSIEIALLFASPVSIKELKKEIHTSLKKNPLHLLCPTKILDNNGSVQATIPPLEISSTEDNIPNEEIILHMAEKQKYKGILIGNSVSGEQGTAENKKDPN